jgi:hypothetical protein
LHRLPVLWLLNWLTIHSKLLLMYHLLHRLLHLLLHRLRLILSHHLWLYAIHRPLRSHH